MDIESLYTNIETKMGLAAVMKCFENTSIKIDQRQQC